MNNLKKMKPLLLVVLISGIVGLLSCNKKDDSVPDPIASFTYEVDADDYLMVTFTNLSKNGESVSWSFGDGNTSTSDALTVTHTYLAVGSYVVTVTVTNSADVTDTFTETITLADPLEAQRALFGTDGKTWQLLADVSGGKFPYEVQPTNNEVFWWALGANEQLCVRECIFDDTWTFKPDGSYVFANNGDYFGEWLGECFDTSVASNWMDGDNDVSGWDAGTYAFNYDPTASELTVTGGFIGVPKATPDGEVSVPAASIKYDVVKLVESNVDTLVLDVVFAHSGSGSGFAYWRTTLVSYNAETPVAVGECPIPEAPTTKAPTPTQNSGNVISLYSDDYTNVTVDTWKTSWSAANHEEVTIDGSLMNKYTNLSFVGIETVANQIDATGMTHFHVDIWTPDATQFRVKWVDFGPTGGYSGAGGDGMGDDTEHELSFDSPTQGAWVSYDIPLSDFTNLTNKTNLAQLILGANPAGSAAVFVDNVYFYNNNN